jgi:hypothetical protein
MRVLVACEASGIVSSAFRARGHHVISSDLYQTDDETCKPYHWVGDVRDILYHPKGWDIIIAHPPCTDLASVGANLWYEKQQDGRQDAAIDFFMELYNAPARVGVAVENPSGIMSRVFRKPNQYVNPWWFGEPWSKRTGLWLRGLPPLKAEVTVKPDDVWPWVDGGSFVYGKWGGKGRYAGSGSQVDRASRSHARSKFFPGIARAMAEQWG